MPPAPGSPLLRALRGVPLPGALLAAGAALVALLLLQPLLRIPLHVPLNYNEGWNAYLDARAAGLQPGQLYPSDGLVFDNYPPLSFHLVGALGRLAALDMIVAGRIVAAASLLASAALAGLCVARLGGSARAGLAASMLLLLYAATLFRGYVAMDDPQWLAHALMLGGLAVLLRDPGAARIPLGQVASAALLVTAGGFVKHSLVALPLAATAWLALLRPRAAAAWLAAAAGAVAAGALATALEHGTGAFAAVLAHRRVFAAARLAPALGDQAAFLPMLLVAALVWHARRRPSDPAALFAALFVAASLLTGTVQRLGEGVNINAHFETLSALCIATGLAVSRAAAVPRRGRPPAALLALAALPALAMAPGTLWRSWDQARAAPALARAWAPVIERIRAAPGLAGCEMPSLCFWAGKPFVVDQFNLGQSVDTGAPIAPFHALAFGIFEYGAHAYRRATTPGPQRRDPLLADLLARGYAPVAGGP
ncbi:MAG: hypothetical protein ACRYG6_09630, partial [Janthinobacterium lividum]